MNKEICFISTHKLSPGNGLSCCCCSCRPNFPARRGHQKRKEAAEPDPNPVRAVETERRRKTAGREALRRSEERRSAKGGRSRRRRCPSSMTSASRPLVAREFSCSHLSLVSVEMTRAWSESNGIATWAQNEDNQPSKAVFGLLPDTYLGPVPRAPL